MKTRVEIINETVKYYSEDTNRRAKIDGKCCYLTNDGKMCAVGRCLTSKYRQKRLNDGSAFHGYMVEEMKPSYQIYDFVFWDNLQDLHDNDKYWTKNSLTEEGKDRVNILLEKYKS